METWDYLHQMQDYASPQIWTTDIRFSGLIADSAPEGEISSYDKEDWGIE